MAKEQIKRFLEEVKSNADLQKQLSGVETTNEGAFVKIANLAGFDFTVDEWLEYAENVQPEKVKISDDELEKVAGGGLFGIDLCQKRWDMLYCQISMCRQLRLEHDGKASGYNSKGNITRRYCLIGHFDQKFSPKV